MNDNIFRLGATISLGLVGILALITLFAWIRQTNWRFAMVGYTGFSLVLTVGLFGLSLQPIMRTSILGASRYTTVYDRGSNQAVIAVEPTITPEELERTLQQATGNLLSSGRYAVGSNLFTVRARTVLHPEPGVTQAIYLGQAQQPLGTRDSSLRTIEIFPEALAQLQAYQETSTVKNSLKS